MPALQLVVAGYTIAYAVLLVTGARLGDILGHRRVYLAGVALFTLASLGCGLAPTTGVLVALRFLQGVGAATMIPQILSLIQRTYTAPGPRARAMSLYATVISGGSVLGQVLGGLLVSREPVRQLAGGRSSSSTSRSAWRCSPSAGCCPRAASTGSARSTCPAWRCSPRPCSRWCCRWCSGSRSAGRCGAGSCWPPPWCCSPCSAGWSTGWRSAAGSRSCPASLLGLPGMIAGLGGLFASMVVFGGWLFGLALELQDGLGDSPLRAGLTFVPCGVAFALVSLNWRRLPARYHEQLPMAGFVVTGASLVWAGLLLHSGGAGGTWLYVALAVTGGGHGRGVRRADGPGARPGCRWRSRRTRAA